MLAMDWIETSGPEELNARHSFVGSGESSGAHLLMLAMLRRRDMGNFVLHMSMSHLLMNSCHTALSTATSWSKWKCLNLGYGVYDLSGSPSIRTDGDTSVSLCGNDVRFSSNGNHVELAIYEGGTQHWTLRLARR